MGSLVIKNTLFLYFRMIFILGATFYISRLLLSELGVIDYGIYNVVGGVIAMMSFLNSSITSGYQRFFNIEIGLGNSYKIQRIISVSLTIQIGLSFIAVLIAESIGIWFVNTQMTIPSSRLIAANWVFQSSILIFVSTLLRAPYNALIISYEKMNLYAYISVLEILLQLLIAFLLGSFHSDKLIVYSILMMIVSLCVTLVYVIVAKRLTPTFSFLPKFYNDTFKDILSFSGWNIFGSVAHLLKSNGINILLNLFFNPAINAARGFANQISSGVLTLSSNVLNAARPQIMKHYAVGNIPEMIDLSNKIARYGFYLLSIFAIPILCQMDFVLRKWLGNDIPQYTVLFSIIVLVTTLVESFAAPISTLIHATGLMKKFQIVVSLVIMSVIPFAYIFLKFGFPPQSAMYVSLFVVCMAQGVRVYLVKQILPMFVISEYLAGVIFKCILVGVASFCASYLLGVIFTTKLNWIQLFVAISCNICIVYLLGLTKKEKKDTLIKLKAWIK